MTATALPHAPGQRQEQRPSQWRRATRRFLRRPPAVLGLAGVVVVVGVAVLAPWIAPYPPSANHYDAVLAPPFSHGYLLGTDDLGRDILSRLMWGARVSLVAGVVATLLAAVVAVPIGMISGFYRSWIDTVFMRLNDVVLSFPFLILAVGLAAMLGPSLQNATIALAVAQFPIFLRISRGEMLGLREQDHMAAARVNGAPVRVMLFRHGLPNMLSPLVVQVTVGIPNAIIGAAILSFLGLGVQPPTPAWGSMLSEAQNYLSQAPLFAVFPGLAIVVTTLAFNLLGDGLRDVLDPRTLS
ncbi:MAG TPA: ABC transporter permease [Streptosporangiaceae bacterium]|nr:ABC transporter permease [Streptosporangiaceae bacterium]